MDDGEGERKDGAELAGGRCIEPACGGSGPVSGELGSSFRICLSDMLYTKRSSV